MEQVVKQVIGVLTGVGFPDLLEWPLRVHLCFRPDKFVVPFQQFRGSDQLRYQIAIVRQSDGNYLPSYYDATLVRPLELKFDNNCPDAVVALNQQMQLVNWEGLLDRATVPTVGDIAELKMVADIADVLLGLEGQPEQVHYAELLRLRYWARTPLEGYARVSSQSRGASEVSQRFHFFSDGEGITLDEAYRFLQHRWHEKRLQEQQRVPKTIASVNSRKPRKG